MVSRFSVENYMSHGAENFRRGNLSCFAIFGYRKSLCFRGLCHDFRFLFENFLSQSAENFRRGEYFSVPLFSGIEKFFASEGYVTTFDFLSNVFCPTVPNNLVDEPFCDVFQKLRWRKNLKIRGGGSIKIYRRKLFVSQ